MSAFDIYSTHIPILAACVAWTKGPVLELGCGNASTPTLHLLCKGRDLISAETNIDWLEQFRQFESPNHAFHLIKDWKDWDGIEQPHGEKGVIWSVALVDSQPGEERVDLIRRLKGRCEWVITHDSERDHNTAADYKYEPAFALYKHAVTYKYLRPYTTILSDHKPFPLDEVEKTWTHPSPKDCPCEPCRRQG